MERQRATAAANATCIGRLSCCTNAGQLQQSPAQSIRSRPAEEPIDSTAGFATHVTSSSQTGYLNRASAML